jgi:hypothetical protein
VTQHFLKTSLEDLVFGISNKTYKKSLTTSGLQKGLIAYYKGKPIVQEGLGFGVPIVRSQIDTYFSKHATIELSDDCIVKEYCFDCVSRIMIGNHVIKNKAFQMGFESMVNVYMKLTNIQPYFLKTQQIIAKALNGSCNFIDIPMIGSAKVEYYLSDQTLKLKSKFDVDIENPKYIMANEQGADYFDHAIVDQTFYAGNKISGWINAKNATVQSDLLNLGFSIHSPNNGRMYVGREKNEYLCWIGINIEKAEPLFDYSLNWGSNNSY